MDPLSIIGTVSAVASMVQFMYDLVQQILLATDIKQTSEEMQYLVREVSHTRNFLQKFLKTIEKVSKLRIKYAELEGPSDQSSTTCDLLKSPVAQLDACLRGMQKQIPKLVDREKMRKEKRWSTAIFHFRSAATDKKVAAKLRVELKYYRDNLQEVLSACTFQDIAIMKAKISEMEKRSSSWKSKISQKFKMLVIKFCTELEKIWKKLCPRKALTHSAKGASNSYLQ